MAETGDIKLAPPDVEVAAADLQFTAMRARGPGGQSVNKVSSAILLRVPLEAIRGLDAAALERLRDLAGSRMTVDDELLLRCDAYRSQRRNRDACLERLRRLAALAVRVPRIRKRTRPSRAAVQRRLDAKRRRSQKKQDRRSPDP